MIAVWVLVVMLTGMNPDVMPFPTRQECEAARTVVVERLAVGSKSDFAFSGPPYGAVSACVLAPVETVKRTT